MKQLCQWHVPHICSAPPANRLKTLPIRKEPMCHLGSESPQDLLYLQTPVIPSSDLQEKGFPRKAGTREAELSGWLHLAAKRSFAQQLLSCAWQGEIWHLNLGTPAAQQSPVGEQGRVTAQSLQSATRSSLTKLEPNLHREA